MDETGKMIGSSCWLVVVGVAIISEKPLSTYYGENFCNITYYLSVYGTVHNFLGGFGIALMRLIFIRFPSKVQLGQMTMTLAICLTTFLLSILVTFYWSTTPRPDQDLTSLCRAESTEYTGAGVVFLKNKKAVYAIFDGAKQKCRASEICNRKQVTITNRQRHWTCHGLKRNSNKGYAIGGKLFVWKMPH